MTNTIGRRPTSVIYSPPASAPPRVTRGASAARYEALDGARGIAVFLMIADHFVGSEGGANAFERSQTLFLAAIEPPIGALFCVVAGVAWAIQAERAGATPRFRRYLVGRALALGAFGVAFHVLFWPTEILVPFGLMMALSALVVGRGPRVAGLLALCVVVAAPVATRLLGGHATTDWIADGVHRADREVGWVTVRYLLFDGNYPLFTWMAFPLIGMVLWQTAGDRSRVKWWCLGATAFGVVVHAIVLRSAPEGGFEAAVRHLARGWTPSSATFALSAGSGAVTVASALLWAHGTSPMPRGFRPFVLFGRASLTHYVLHIAVAYSLLRLWYPDEDWSPTLGFLAMLAYLAAAVPLTHHWFRMHTHGPLETLWAWTARRPPPRPTG